MDLRIKFVAAVGLLFCSLVLLEVPELVSLTDDASNDFVLLISPNGIKSSAVHTDRSEPQGIAQIIRQDQRSILLRWLRDSSTSSNDFLHLICIQRT